MKDGLISFNNFLSTSKNEQLSLGYAQIALTKADTAGILFQMGIDPSVSSIPSGSIEYVSYYRDEEEILLSMHSVFRIVNIEQVEGHHLLCRVHLRLTSDDDQQLRTLTNRRREEIPGETGWKRLGLLLAKIGQFDKVEELYRTLIEHS